METFHPHRLADPRDGRPGDGIHWQKDGWLSGGLSWVIKKIKEPWWDAWDWHLTPVVFVGTPSQINDWIANDLNPVRRSLGMKAISEFQFTADNFVAIDAVLVDAQFPTVRLSLLSAYLAKGRAGRAYRVVPVPPPQWKFNRFTADHVGRPYDFLVYLWTALRCFRDVPRVINRLYDCWEVLYNCYEYCCRWCPDDGTDYDYNYPWLPDLRRAYGEMPLKK